MRYDPKNITTKKQARAEAKVRLREQHGLNDAGMLLEVAYSQSTCAVGCRWVGPEAFHDARFTVWNVYYPMYGRDELVNDWISVGVARPKPEGSK